MAERPILASYATWDEIQRDVVEKGDWRPPTPDDVSRVMLSGPPATLTDFLVARRSGVTGDNLAGE